MRTQDMLGITDLYEERLKNLFSIECWGGATFDVALRFLKEDPLGAIRKVKRADAISIITNVIPWI
jgi:pyruvate carboxylase